MQTQQPISELPPVETLSELSEESTLDLTPYVREVFQRRSTVFAFTVFGLIVGAVLAVIEPPKYTAVSSFLPPGGGGTSIANQLGALSGASLLVGAKTPGDLYAGVLGSFSVRNELVSKFDLASVYKTKRQSDAAAALAKHTTIEVGTKDSIVTVSVTDYSPGRARDLANGYLDTLQRVNGKLAITEAAQRKLFFQKELEAEKQQLADAEVSLKQTQEQTGYILPNSQAALQVSSVAETQTEIAGRQVRLAALMESSTDRNPEVVRLRSEIGGLRMHLTELLRGTGRASGVSTQEVPKVALESVRKERDVKYHEALFEILSRQYEAAHLDEAKEGPTLQILDIASTPDKRSGPSRLLILVGGFVLGAAVGIIVVLFRAYKGRLSTWTRKYTADLYSS